MSRPAAFPLLALFACAAAVAAPRKPVAPPTHAPPPVRWVQPTGLAVDRAGNLFVTDLARHQVLRLDPTGILTVVAGTGIGGFSGDGGLAVKARLHAPHDLAVDARGELLIADTYNHRIRRVDRRGIITTVAGNGRGARAGDGGPARLAALNNPQGLAVESGGGILIADTYNHVVRRVDESGTITTFAGTEAGLAGDGGPAERAQISLPTAVAVGPPGSVGIADSGNNRIRWVARDGTIRTLLGTGPGSGTAGAGYGGDGGPPARARVFAPADLESPEGGRLLISDTGNHRIRGIANDVITTVCGSGLALFAGDGGLASAAALNSPQKIAAAADGSLYIADRGNGRVRRVDPEGRIHTVTPRPR